MNELPHQRRNISEFCQLVNQQWKTPSSPLGAKPMDAATDSFFHRFTRDLASALDSHCAFVAKFREDSSPSIETLAVWGDGSSLDPFTACLTPAGIKALTSQTPFFMPLSELGVAVVASLLIPEHETWLIIPIVNAHQRLLGLAAIAGDRPTLTATLTLDHPLVNFLTLQLAAELDSSHPEPTFENNQHRLTNVIDSLPGIVFASNNDPFWSMRYLSQGCLPLTGYRSEELLPPSSLAFHDIVYPDDLQRILAVFNQAIAQRQPYVVEYRIRTKTGAEKWCWEKGMGVFDPEGNAIGLDGFITDITELKTAAEALKFQEEFLRLVLDNIPQSIFWKDTQSVYLGCNRSWATMVGLSHPSEVVGKTDDDFYWESDIAQRYRETDRKTLETGKPQSRQNVPRVQADGQVIWTDFTKIPIPDENHSIIGILGMVENITERRQAELQLHQQAERDRLLKDILLKIRQSLNLDDILNTTVAEVRQFLQVDRVMVYRFETEQHGRLVAASVSPDWSIESDLALHQTWMRATLVPDDQPAAPRPDHCYTSVIDDVSQNLFTAEHQNFLKQLHIQSKLVVPILQGEASWGVLVVHQCAHRRQWQPFEIDLLEQLATQMAIAIQQAQLFNQVQQQAQRERLLNQINRSINSSLDPQHILQEIVKLTGECFAVDQVVLYRVDQDFIHAQYEWRVNPHIQSTAGAILPRSDWFDLSDPTSDFLNHRAFHAPDYINARPFSPERIQVIQQQKVLSVLCAPIHIRDQLFGGLALHTQTCYRTFTVDEISLVERIADQTAIALYNAQSYERLEQLVQERTQQLEAEKVFSEAANRAKSEFLAIMSHELRTPLNAILGLSDLLQREIFGALTPKQREYITCIHTSGDHLLALINDILDLSKVEAGKEELILTPVMIPQFCNHCLSLVQEKATAAHLMLSCQVDPDIEFWVADERRLRQMVLNLLSNAIKFTAQGRVSLSVEKHPQGIALIVQDTGIGIAADNIPLLFQPFCQIDSQLNRRYEGTGLGLALTQRLAHLHGGNVTVESVLGVGSCFTIMLPPMTPSYPLEPSLSASEAVFANGTDTPGYTTSPYAPPRPKRILIVEDDQASAMMLQDYLNALGYEVKHLEDGHHFLAEVRKFSPALILLDVQLGQDWSGIDLLVALRQQDDVKQLPVVMLTALAMRGDRERCLAAGATDYISKPIGILQLESLLLRCF